MPMLTARALLAAAVLAAGGTGLAACAEDERSEPVRGSDQRRASVGTDAERAFLQAMVPHHRSAIAMGRLAERRAESPEIRELAQSIVRAQRTEIRQMERIHQRLFGEPLRPDEMAYRRLGLNGVDAGMNHEVHDVARLRRAKRFDREFVTAMSPHHSGAVRMAQAVRPKARDRELRELAQIVIRDQRREIGTMRAFLERVDGEGPGAGGEDGHGGGGHSRDGA